MDENKEVFLEDVMNDVVEECLDHAKALTPGSEEHISVVNEVTALYSTQAKYASEEAQREHDKEMKLYDISLRNKDLELREKELEFKRDELESQKKQHKLDNVLKGVDVGAKVLGTVGVLGTMFLALKSECEDNRWMSSGIWKWASGIGNKFIRPPM